MNQEHLDGVTHLEWKWLLVSSHTKMSGDKKALTLAVMVHWSIHFTQQCWNHSECLFRENEGVLKTGPVEKMDPSCAIWEWREMIVQNTLASCVVNGCVTTICMCCHNANRCFMEIFELAVSVRLTRKSKTKLSLYANDLRCSDHQ